jgi:short-subunit dehydrogenase
MYVIKKEKKKRGIVDINILFAVTIAFAKDHKEDGIIFVPVHPGMVETQMFDEAQAVKGEHNGAKSITTEESAKKQLEVLSPSLLPLPSPLPILLFPYVGFVLNLFLSVVPPTHD